MKYQNLGNMTYDPADPEDNSFLPDYNKHMEVLADVDRRLASLFSQGLDECHNVQHFFKACFFFSALELTGIQDPLLLGSAKFDLHISMSL